MPSLSGQYGVGAFFVLISALLHLAALVFGGFSTDAIGLGVAGVVYLIIVAGLTRNMRWLAWITFFLVGIGGSVALSYVWADTTVPTWIFIGIVVADWLAALGLFVALWKPKDSRRQA
ncbi:hypothetical protein [Yoonia sp. 2307UL14-13]|uniref:hypothetical protein n=1 Tax=Yoonia sp. 2307UL14-13 TaxID=3126506 RepID=UPI0030966FB0